MKKFKSFLALQQLIPMLAGCLFALLLLSGCASTKVTDRKILVTEKLPRPAHVWVYNFADTSAEVPEPSALAGTDTAPQTAEQIDMGHQIGFQIAMELVQEISDLGMPAVQAVATTKPEVNDIVIQGYLLTVDEGSAVKRVTIGFGSGGSKLSVAVEGFQMTATGLRKLGSGTVDAGGGKSPGAAVGAATFIATANPIGLVVSGGIKAYGEASGSAKIEGRAKAVAQEIGKQIKPRFEQQGWIQ
jgi:hypothetical protein